MTVLRNRVGARFGRLVAKSWHKKGRYTVWLCTCDCGNSTHVIATNLGRNIRSCGCISENAPNRWQNTHGMTNTPLHLVWMSLRQRCNDPGCPAYPQYGGLGISYDPAWANFQVFYQDMAPTYQPGLTLARVDVNGNYCKDNCCWATRLEQARNKTNSIRGVVSGHSMALAVAVEHFGMVAYGIAKARVYRGWSVEDAASIPAWGRRFTKRISRTRV